LDRRMSTPFASSAVIGWIDIRPDSATPESWQTPDDDLTADLWQLACNPFEASASSSSKTARFAPRVAAAAFSPAPSCYAAATSNGAIGQIFANLAELSRELDARLADIRARLSVA
jgi:hypothetical protein